MWLICLAADHQIVKCSFYTMEFSQRNYTGTKNSENYKLKIEF